MKALLADLGINIAANLIFWLLLGLVIRYIVVRKARSRFLEFFGLENNRKLVVYLSNLWDPTVGKKPWGCILSGHEFQVVRCIGNLFGSAPFSLPDMVRGLVDTIFIGKKLNVTFDVSTDEFDLASNLIVVGATTKNSVRRYYARNNMLHVTIAGEPTEPPTDIHDKPLKKHFKVKKGPAKGSLKLPQTYNLAIIEKIHDEDNKRVVFMCTGWRGDSSWAATEYLVRNWSELCDKFGNRSFARCLGFSYAKEPMRKYIKPTHIRDFPA